MTEQLTLDGMPTLAPGPVPNGDGLNATQREIIRIVRDEGLIRPITAGVLVHRARRGGGADDCDDPGYHGDGCCRYASTDGLEACKRLVRRGLLYKSARGEYSFPHPVAWKPDLETQKRQALLASDDRLPELSKIHEYHLRLLADGPKSNADFNELSTERTLIIALGKNVDLRAHGLAGWIEADEPTHAITDAGRAYLLERKAVEA